MLRSWTKGSDQHFSCETWSVNFEWCWEIATDHVQMLYILQLGPKKCFFTKILLILPKFHRKTLKRPGDINFFRPGRWMYMYTLPPFMDAVLNEERQLMKWVRILQVGIFWVGNFRLGIFLSSCWKWQCQG